MPAARFVVFFMPLVLLALACSREDSSTVVRDPAPRVRATSPEAQAGAQAAPSRPAQSAPLVARARAVLAAFRARDGRVLAALASPRGVRFSPYAYVDTKSDVVLTPAELARAMTDPKPRRWGSYDGSGQPIVLPFAAYGARFVWSHDFSAAPDVAVDRSLGSGNTFDNLAAAYPGAHWVEFHFPGFDPKLGGMDWQSLRLVFDASGLVGVVHAEWTI